MNEKEEKPEREKLTLPKQNPQIAAWERATERFRERKLAAANKVQRRQDALREWADFKKKREEQQAKEPTNEVVGKKPSKGPTRRPRGRPRGRR